MKNSVSGYTGVACISYKYPAESNCRSWINYVIFKWLKTTESNQRKWDLQDKVAERMRNALRLTWHSLDLSTLRQFLIGKWHRKKGWDVKHKWLVKSFISLTRLGKQNIVIQEYQGSEVLRKPKILSEGTHRKLMLYSVLFFFPLRFCWFLRWIGRKPRIQVQSGS